MIREIVKPKDNSLVINIPNEYIGQEVEYLVFPLQKTHQKESEQKVDIDSLGGVFNKYSDPSKVALEDKAWELHVKDKFTK